MEEILRKAGEGAGMVGEWVKVRYGEYEGECIGCARLVRASLGEEFVGSNAECKKEPGFCLLTQLGIESRKYGRKV